MFAIYGALSLLLLQAALAPAQLITLRDGKVGVNFAGFHADAGLGGLLTGNAAHGGLSASAGTPWSSRAAAGIGGGLNGRTAGGAYAAAQANDQVGASALLGGSVGERGYIGSEAHAPGKVAGHSVRIAPEHKTVGPDYVDLPPVLPTAPSHVQRVKPPKKYSLIAPSSDHNADSQISEHRVKTTTVPATVDIGPSQQHELTPLIIVKRPRLRVKRPRQRQRNVYVTQVVNEETAQEQGQQQETVLQAVEPVKAAQKSDAKVVHKYVNVAAPQPHSVTRHVVASQAQGNVVGNALEIPIGILRSLQLSLGNLAGVNQPQQQQQGSFAGLG